MASEQEGAPFPADRQDGGVANPPPVPQASLLDQYEIGDGAIDPETDFPPEPQPRGPAAAATPPATPPKPQHSTRALRMAADLGFSQADIDVATPDQLEDAIYWTTRERLARSESYARERSLNQTNVQPSPPSGTAPPPPSEEGYDLGFKDGDFDPALTAPISKALGDAFKRIKELEAKLESYGQREQARERETVAERIDRLFEQLGQSYEPVFGKGRGQEMQPGSAEYDRRVAVLSVMDRLPQGTFEQKFQRAVQTLFGRPPQQTQQPVQQPPDLAPQRPRDPDTGRFTREQWNGAGLARPTQRDGAPEPKGDRRAAKAVAAKMREMGMGDGSEEYDELPD